MLAYLNLNLMGKYVKMFALIDNLLSHSAAMIESKRVPNAEQYVVTYVTWKRENT